MFERRRHPRVDLPAQRPRLSTKLGELVNLSESGLCVFHKGRLGHAVGDTLELVLTHNGQMHRLRVRVARAVPVGVRRHELGLELVEAEDATRAWLRSIIASPSDFSGPQAWLAA